MTYRELQYRAHREWQNSGQLRQRYPTFVHYWRECYQRVYQHGGWRELLARWRQVFPVSGPRR